MVFGFAANENRRKRAIVAAIFWIDFGCICDSDRWSNFDSVISVKRQTSCREHFVVIF